MRFGWEEEKEESSPEDPGKRLLLMLAAAVVDAAAVAADAATFEAVPNRPWCCELSRPFGADICPTTMLGGGGGSSWLKLYWLDSVWKV